MSTGFGNRLPSPAPAHPVAGLPRVTGRKIWVPRMTYGSARAFVASLRSCGIDAEVLPPSDESTRELGARYTCGDECYPMKVTLGDFVKLLEKPEAEPGRTALFMPSGQGPCRFGQYATHLRRVLTQQGYANVVVVSPKLENNYSELGEVGPDFVRTTWRGVVASDLLMKHLLRVRPYERLAGSADAVYESCLEDLCRVLEKRHTNAGAQMEGLKASLIGSRERFRQVPMVKTNDRPLIGIVGEIFCRLNAFSNYELVRRLENVGGAAWFSDLAEWIWYVNFECRQRRRREGRRFSLTALQAGLREHFQKQDEHELVQLFAEDFRGMEEPHGAEELARLAEPYLPAEGASGEMVMSVGKAVYMAKKGADGIIDISPFTCMNGIVCEAIYPRISRENGGIPIRIFYFDGAQMEIERDLEIFLELARSYRRRRSRSESDAG